ncbi:MAG: ureidoglycolate lyase [Halieaceae bacterium]|jgi:ureidoglycolate lyase
MEIMTTAETPATPTSITVKVQTPSIEKLEKYGTVLGYNPNVEPLPIEFYGGAAKVRRLGEFKAQGEIEMPVTTLQRRPFLVSHMERHMLHTQAFISLGAKPFIVCFAPPNDKELPDLDEVEAFLFDGDAGFMMHAGTWHEFPFAVLDDTQLLVILTKSATEGLVKDNVIQNEAIGPDIEKRDLKQRFGLTIRLEV